MSSKSEDLKHLEELKINAHATHGRQQGRSVRWLQYHSKLQAMYESGDLVPAEETESLREDAARYRWLRERDLETIHQGGVFAGMTPDNVVINGDDLDFAIDARIARAALRTDKEGQSDG